MTDNDSQPLVLETRRIGDSATVVVAGELDAYAARRFEECGADLLNAGVRELSVDLANTTFLDSSGLRALLAVRERVVVAGGLLAIDNPSETVQRLLEITGLNDQFNVRHDAGRRHPTND